MSTISTKINLCGLKHSVRKFKGQSGEIECLIIPIEVNNLFRGDKGVYLDLTGFEIKNKVNDSKDTIWLSKAFQKKYTKK